jgi:hypothetical protein
MVRGLSFVLAACSVDLGAAILCHTSIQNLRLPRARSRPDWQFSSVYSLPHSAGCSRRADHLARGDRCGIMEQAPQGKFWLALLAPLSDRVCAPP